MTILRKNTKTYVAVPCYLALFAGMLFGFPVTSVATETLGYDLKGNIISRQNESGTTSYQYDSLDRLIDEQGPQATQGFTYDANGNRLTDGVGGYTYTPSSNVMATEHGNTVVHDAAGNLIDDGQGLTFEYNQAGRLKRVFDNSTLVATYIYNAFGQRTRKVTPSGTTVYHYDLGGKLTEETLDNGMHQVSYVWRENKPTSVIYAPGTPSNSGAQEKLVYLHADHLNTPRQATDEAGTVVWHWESDAFGSTVVNEDPDSDGSQTIVNLRFPGQYNDLESGNYYNHYRYYDPSIGRYNTNDPIGLAGGANSYLYAQSNPQGYIDPFGLDANLFLGDPAEERIVKFNKLLNKPNYYTVLVHGDPINVYDDRNGRADRKPLSPIDLAKIIGDKAKGQVVILYSCNTGVTGLNGEDSFAQLLADELGVPVIAPNRNLELSDGSINMKYQTRDGNKVSPFKYDFLGKLARDFGIRNDADYWDIARPR